MRRIILAASIASAALSCSWTTYFFVANNSPQPLRLEYTARTIPAFPSPFIVPLKAMKHLDGPRVTAAAQVRQLDSLVQYSLLVPPDSAVAIFAAGTYTGSESAENIVDWAFAPLRLSVQTTRGSRAFEGGEVPRAFQRLSRFAYVLEIE